MYAHNFVKNTSDPYISNTQYTTNSIITGLSPPPPELATPAQRRDALRYLCLLLPQANRDTLQELLRFLTRVALRSNGIILIDGTEVSLCPPTISLRVKRLLVQ